MGLPQSPVHWKAMLRAIWLYTNARHLAAHEWQWCLFQIGHVKMPEKPLALPDTADNSASETKGR